MFLSPNLCTSRRRLIRWNFSLSWRFQPRKSFYQFSRAFDVDRPRRPWIYARPKMAKCSIILSHVPPIINSNLPISESLIFISQKTVNFHSSRNSSQPQHNCRVLAPINASLPIASATSEVWNRPWVGTDECQGYCHRPIDGARLLTKLFSNSVGEV